MTPHTTAPSPAPPPGPPPAPPAPSPFPRRALLRGTLGLGLFAGLGTLTSCGDDTGPEPTSGPVTLSMWTHDQGYQDFFTKGIADADRRTDFRYHLDVTRAGAHDVVTKLLAQAVAGRGTPDVVSFEIGSFPRMLRGDIAERLLHDFTDDVADIRDDLLPSRTAPYSRDGRLYALDSDTPLVVYYYRDDLFAEYGIPTDTPTWEEFAEVGARAHDRHGVALTVVATGSGDIGQVTSSFQMLLLQRGGAFFDRDQQCVVDSPEAEEVLTFIRDGLRSGFVTDVTDMYGASMQAALKSGKVAGLHMATWYETFGLKPNVPEQSGRWRVRAMPRFSGGGHATATAGGTGFGVLTGKPHTRAGTAFLLNTWLTHEGQVRRYQELGYLPTRASVYEDPKLTATEDEFCGGQRLFDVYNGLLDDIPAVYLSPDQSILNDVLGGYLLRAYRGDLSPRDALRRAAEDFRDQAGR
ncbi:hypothetical protein GCM10027168_21160 [Streptomyces capparidis]